MHTFVIIVTNIVCGDSPMIIDSREIFLTPLSQVLRWDEDNTDFIPPSLCIIILCTIDTNT